MSALEKLIDGYEITFYSEGETVKEARAELAAKDAEIVRLRKALAKSDPWTTPDGEQNYVFVCRHCGHKYDVMNGEAPDQHEADCIWRAALLAPEGGA